MGIDDRTLEPALIDIERQGPHMIVIGQPFSGKTTTLRTLILSAASNYTPDEFMLVLIDYSRKLWKGSEHSLAELPHVVQTIDDIEQLDEFYREPQGGVRRLRCQPAPPQDHDRDRQLRRLYRRIQPQEDDLL
jgi:hypothetical protein